MRLPALALVAATAALVALTGPAIAQGAGGACQADMQRLCPDAGDDRQAGMR